jgi:hypothetical protein
MEGGVHILRAQNVSLKIWYCRSSFVMQLFGKISRQSSFARHFSQELQSNESLSYHVDEVQYCKKSPPNEKDKANRKRKEVQ